MYSRDCSVQRRHQKIVEEGPVSAVRLKSPARKPWVLLVFALRWQRRRSITALSRYDTGGAEAWLLTQAATKYSYM